jgi:hypothetical protein
MDGLPGLHFDLNPAEAELLACSRAGVVSQPDRLNGDPADAAGWEHRTVRGDVLAAICTSAEQLHRSGVRLRHALIDGPLDLSFQCLSVPLLLEDCRVTGAIDLSDASCPALTFDRCHLLEKLTAPRLRVDGCLTLAGAVAHAPIELYDARVGADFDCSRACLHDDESDAALSAAGLEVGADLLIDDVVSAGSIVLQQVHVGRSVAANRLTASHEGGAALMLSGATVKGDVMLSGATLDGSMDADGLTVDGSLLLDPALVDDKPRRFSAGGVNLSNAALGLLDARGASLTSSDAALELWGARIARNALLDVWESDNDLIRFEATGGLNLTAVQIGGTLSLSGARLEGDLALYASRSHIDGGASLDSVTDGDGGLVRFEARGLVSFVDARLGSLDSVGGAFRTDGETALNLFGATIARDVRLMAGPNADRHAACEFEGGVELSSATIGGDLACSGARVNVDGLAIRAPRVQVAGDVFLDYALDEHGREFLLGADGTPARFYATGGLDFSNGRLGALDCAGAFVAASGDVALDLAGTEVMGNVELSPTEYVPPNGEPALLRCEMLGLVRLNNARVHGDVACRGARCGDDDLRTHAFQAISARVDGSLRLATSRLPRAGVARFEAWGGVAVQATSIGGELLCSGGSFKTTEGSALDLYSVAVANDVLLTVEWDDGSPMLGADGRAVCFEAEGDLFLADASVTKSVICSGARVSGDVVASRLSVGGTLKLDGVRRLGGVYEDGAGPVTFDVARAVYLDSADAGHVDCTSARLGAFLAPQLKVVHELVFKDVSCSGIDLRNASVTTLDDDIESWLTETLDLEGFTYHSLAGTAPRDWKQRAHWLERQTRYTPQPYLQLASAYRLEGDDRAVRKISMERFNAQLRVPARSWRGRVSKLNRWLLRGLIGHGYEPWRAVVPLIVLLAIGTMVISAAARDGHMIPVGNTAADPKTTATDCDRRDHPCLQPLVYSADLLVPVINLGQRERWRPVGPTVYRIVPPLIVFAGWALTTLIVAGFTGVVRRD